MTTQLTQDSPPALAPRRTWAIAESVIVHAVTAGYLVLVGLLVARHALWRDEAQAFNIARDSRTLGELIWNLRYEGHPPLWHLLLWGLTRFTARPEAMQILHVAIAGGAVYLVMRFSPLPLLARVLFPFGYFMAFEYSVIARNYGLFVLLLAAVCVLWQRRRAEGKRYYLWIGILLALLALSHVLGLILGAGFGVMMLAESAFTRTGWKAVRAHWWQFLLGILIAGAGAAWSVYLLIPPADYNFAVGWAMDLRHEHVELTRYTIWNGLVPVDHPGVAFWDDNALLDHDRGGSGLADAAFWGPIVLAACALLVITSWRAILFLLVAGGGAVAFQHIKMYHLYGFGGGTRHHGVLFVAVIAACWIAWAGKSLPTRWWRRLAFWLPPRLGLCALLAVHVWGAWIAVDAAWHYPFSMSKATAEGIAPKLGKDDILLGPIDYLITPVAAYLPGRDVFLADEGRWHSFAYWERIPPAGRKSAQQWAMEIARERKRPVVVVSYGSAVPPGAELLGRFTGQCIQPDETYTVYRITPEAAAQATRPSLRSIFGL